MLSDRDCGSGRQPDAGVCRAGSTMKAGYPLEKRCGADSGIDWSLRKSTAGKETSGKES